MAARFYESARHVKEMVDSDQFKEEDKKGIDLPFIDFESILAATDNFSEANKLRGLFTCTISQTEDKAEDCSSYSTRLKIDDLAVQVAPGGYVITSIREDSF
ncbi:hypothetical protein CUMW_138200 [Citrus unshiu]|uniref:Uncharacterized protein n=1 Tax=Citrus unshiu TaxID=55188 RepID=A0A2H5PHV3_CITUN|nr:hypothetical protein CUMW_138200 [Citrus unshiu]